MGRSGRPSSAQTEALRKLRRGYVGHITRGQYFAELRPGPSASGPKARVCAHTLEALCRAGHATMTPRYASRLRVLMGWVVRVNESGSAEG